MECIIEEVKPSQDLEKYAIDGFLKHSLETIDYDGAIHPYAFALKEKGKVIGSIMGKTFFGALHIKYFFLEEDYRNKGYGSALIEKVLEKGKEMGCSFAYLETFNFQALGFYQKLGFTLEYTREGYHQGVAMHYLRKSL
jgi:ribosomal protein S18 acetylase RimI-like enzyme